MAHRKVKKHRKARHRASEKRAYLRHLKKIVSALIKKNPKKYGYLKNTYLMRGSAWGLKY